MYTKSVPHKTNRFDIKFITNDLVNEVVKKPIQRGPTTSAQVKNPAER